VIGTSLHRINLRHLCSAFIGALAIVVTGTLGAIPASADDGCVIQGEGTPCTLSTTAGTGESPALWTGLDIEGPDVAWQLFNHYEDATGTDAVVSWDYMMSWLDFSDLIYSGSIPIGQTVEFTPAAGEDLQLAMGTFAVTRDSEHCYETYDLYDFDKAGAYSPLADQADTGAAAPFNTHSSGCI
jgi:hypothetical protein